MDTVDSHQAISEAINYLGINLLKELSKEIGNVFFSPFSISSALAMGFIGSSHETAEEMTTVLGYEVAKVESGDVKTSFHHLFSEINKTSNLCTLNVANVVFGDCNLSVQEDFKKSLRDFFHALFVDVDFMNDSAAAVKKANDWIKTKTENKISHLLDSLDSDTKLVILNAVYFRGFWLHAFKEKSTFLQHFYNKGLDDEPKLVEMMHLKEKFFYANDNSFKALKLPYKGENLAMLLLLPNSRNGVDKLEQQITTEFLRHVNETLCETEVKVALPKLHLEYSKSLKNALKNLGLRRAFEAGAHFDQMCDKENLYVSDVIHKAVLEVNEEGTEVAASTAVMMNKYSRTHCAEFIIDHPFVFLIYNCKNDLILFMGKVVEL
ncbi:intracellular coagulation inhibitor 2 isoform X2 [Parasteatoda tepidariorum]|uniref:intracellular coagulation inhibitor 2 isoform X2 n=1 Tax=Parasteatoda tepidariorum TaxID=114398 RepID=UPI00077FAE85|nr:intracellular coagulation inhibitor 2 isoform X2 [Parasteatoda tepidariorum]